MHTGGYDARVDALTALTVALSIIWVKYGLFLVVAVSLLRCSRASTRRRRGVHRHRGYRGRHEACRPCDRRRRLTGWGSTPLVIGRYLDGSPMVVDHAMYLDVAARRARQVARAVTAAATPPPPGKSVTPLPIVAADDRDRAQALADATRDLADPLWWLREGCFNTAAVLGGAGTDALLDALYPPAPAPAPTPVGTCGDRRCHLVVDFTADAVVGRVHCSDGESWPCPTTPLAAPAEADTHGQACGPHCTPVIDPDPPHAFLGRVHGAGPRRSARLCPRYHGVPIDPITKALVKAADAATSRPCPGCGRPFTYATAGRSETWAAPSGHVIERTEAWTDVHCPGGIVIHIDRDGALRTDA